MATAKFKVYSKRVDDTISPSQLCFGLSRVVATKDDPADFGTERQWGEIQINCDQGVDTAAEFEIGDIVHVTFENKGKEEDATESKPARRRIVDEDEDDEEDENDDEATKEAKKAAKAAKTTPKKA